MSNKRFAVLRSLQIVSSIGATEGMWSLEYELRQLFQQLQHEEGVDESVIKSTFPQRKYERSAYVSSKRQPPAVYEECVYHGFNKQNLGDGNSRTIPRFYNY